MNTIKTIMARELTGYFSTPVAYVFLIIFLALTSSLTFYMGNFFVRGQADLQPFFMFHPWLFLFLIPAISMRLWAEEKKSGTIELLFTLPLTTAQAVIGKFLAAWIFIGIALLLTFPIWITVNYLGNPDNGTIITGYIGSFLMAGGFLAIGTFISGLTQNQVIAFVLSSAVCFIFTVSGTPMILNIFGDWAPAIVSDTIASFSFLTHFNNISRGIIDITDIVFFTSITIFFLYFNIVTLNAKRAG